MQRLRDGDFFEIMKKYDDFPVILETMRDCLNDRMDFESFLKGVSDIEAGRIAVHAIRTEVPSPFSASLLFGFIGAYMYEDDRPRAEWHSQLTGLFSMKSSTRRRVVTLSNRRRSNKLKSGCSYWGQTVVPDHLRNWQSCCIS